MGNNTNSVPLAGELPEKDLDPFAKSSENSDTTRELLRQLEEMKKEIEKDTQGKPAPIKSQPIQQKPQQPAKPKAESPLMRLINNIMSAIKPAKKPAVPSVPMAQTIKPLPVTPNLQKVIPKAQPTKLVESHHKVRKAFVLLFLILGLCLFGYLVLFFTNMDSSVFQLGLTGTIIDQKENKPIVGAEILINGSTQATTDEKGQYSVSGLNYDQFEFRVRAPDYADFVENLAIPKQVLNYSLRKDIFLTSSKLAIVTGRFIADDPTYKFLLDKLYINEKEYKLNEDGTYNLSSVPVGKATILFESVRYKDINFGANLVVGGNNIPEFTLEPSADIVGTLKSYVRDDIVLNTRFEIENVTAEQIKINDDGKFRIRDLDIGREYKIRVFSNGYETRDYALTTSQGDNELFGFKLVEEGAATYIGKAESALTSDQIFSADLDGQNVVQLTAIKNLDAKFVGFDSRDNKMYFTSDYEEVRPQQSSITLLYTVDLETKNIARVTNQNLTSITNLAPNIRAKKMINQRQLRTTGQVQQQIQILDFSGENIKDLRAAKNITEVKISDNGNFVALRENETTISDAKLDSKLVRVDVQTGEAREITTKKNMNFHDISEDGNRLIFTALNEQTTFVDLLLYDAQTQETRTIKENHDGMNYQFINPDNGKIIFSAKREGRNNIYLYDIALNTTERITNLAPDDEIRVIYQQERFTFYRTQKGLYVIDPLKPQSFVFVTDKITNYLGTNF